MFENENFLKSVIALAKEAKCKVTVPSEEQSNDDRWMQVCAPWGGQVGGAGETHRVDLPEGQGTWGAQAPGAGDHPSSDGQEMRYF